MSALIALEEAVVDEQHPVNSFSAKAARVVALIGASALVAAGGAAASWHMTGATTTSVLGGRRLQVTPLATDTEPEVTTLTFPIATPEANTPMNPRTLLDEKCSNDGEDCRASQCCTNTGSTCFRKNDHWASCNATCAHNYKWWNNGWVNQGEKHIWDCHTLSCSDDGQNCMSSRCCTNSNSKCFRKNEQWASCNSTCTQNYKWESTGWVEQTENIWDCVELLPKQECDMTECEQCSGEQCQYCHEMKERDCCLDDACRGAQGEQVAQCRRDRLETCCQGKSEHCKGGSNTLQCDTSSCDDGCSGEECEHCKVLVERNCCLEAACQESPNEAMCFTNNLENCCTGKSGRCKDQHGPSPVSTRTIVFKQ